MDFIFDHSLVLYLPLYELDGSPFIMSKDAYGHLCTVTGAVWGPNGRYFDATDDNINIPDTASLDITAAITLEAWICPFYKDEYDYVLDNGQSYRLVGYRDSTEYRMALNIGGWKYSPMVVFTKEVWAHAVGTYDGAAIETYKNGVASGSPTAQEGSMNVPTNDLVIGGQVDLSPSRMYQGYIGEVRVYNRALTPLEIQHNYLATKWRYR